MDITKTTLDDFIKDFTNIENEISKGIIGQNDIIRGLLTAIISNGNVLLEGLPGLGKTQMVKVISKVLDLDFSRIQFTPDLMPADVTGTDIFVKNKEGENTFKFQKGPIFANIVLADEINRATPKTQSALLEAMQEKTVTVGNTTYKLPEPFFVLATQNPLELEGTYPLPEAQMDRFILKLDVAFPNKTELHQIVNLTTRSNNIEIRNVLKGERLIEMSEIAKNIPIASSVIDYALDIILKTHPEFPESPEITKKYLRYGSSPRGAQSIISIAKIFAILDNRANVSFDDIEKAALPCLRHRMFLNFEGIAEGVTTDDIILELVRRD